ncbi:triphosphoribosyl-dephospho-CoA synthase CitG [Consotaella salsifontis]|uniref:triphosphoribosyl-dephospho-CoA synthase CitG n=1 Tax=Consotaella salsifontis TaxID=1365950 RepID=UPI001A966B9E|nr:triphosphoribosyl-dephospho-CoA synthase CitG [Consotaella salsifontis]
MTSTAWAGLAYRALIREVTLTPKPGLVDRRNSGANRDMKLSTFMASAAAIAPFFLRFHRCGVEGSGIPPRTFLASIRGEGIACERAMLTATGGVNCHKGSIFALGLLLAAAGRLSALPRRPDVDDLCEEVARMCDGLVEAELGHAGQPRTAGEHLYRLHGLTGARGEAASGFATVRQYSLPAYRQAREAGAGGRMALLSAFLELLAVNADTNIVTRGGVGALRYIQEKARRLRAMGGIDHPGFIEAMIVLDEAMIERNLNPGGSADLLAVTWFLAHAERLGGGTAP